MYLVPGKKKLYTGTSFVLPSEYQGTYPKPNKTDFCYYNCFNYCYLVPNMEKKEEKVIKEERKPVVIKNATDLQKLKLEKLMKNPVSFCIFILYIHVMF